VIGYDHDGRSALGTYLGAVNTVLRLLVLAAALTPGAASAQTWSGNDLYRFCAGASTYHDAGVCLGYVVGVTDASSQALIPYTRLTISEIGTRGGAEWCLPKGVETGQMVDVVTKYLESHPADRHIEADYLVAHALAEAWPCEWSRGTKTNR
jgi:Rap1a immunity proteins